MGFTSEERVKILEGIPLEIQERAKAGDQEAVSQVKTAISNWRNSKPPDFSIIDDPVIPQSIVERSNAIELAKEGNFNWDQISGMIDSGRLTDDVINFFQEEGYSTTQSASGGRIYNIGKKSNLKYKEHRQAKGVVDRVGGSVKDFVTIPWRGLGEDDPTAIDADDFYRHVLKQPKGDWARTGIEKLIIQQLEERQASEQEAYEKYGDAADIQAAGKIQSMVNAKTITAPNPRDWFPTSFQKSEDGKFLGNKDELRHYKNVIKEYDPFAAHQASLLEYGQRADFYYQLKEQDQEWLDRLEKLHREGRTHLHDPEVFDWFVRRGMEKQQDLTLGQAVDAGKHLLGEIWKGAVGSKDGKGLIQEFWEGAVHGKQEAQEVSDIMGAGWRGLGSDYQLLSENAGGYFLDRIEKPGDEASPEAQELYRKAKNERQRQFQLRALSNQAVYAAGAHDLANKWWQNPQQAQRNQILSTFVFDPLNLVPMGGLGKKGVEAGVRTGVNATFGSALKTAKNAADEAAVAVADAQAALGREIVLGDPAKVINAGKVLDDAVKASDDAAGKLADVARSAENMYEELMQAGPQRMSGHAINMMGQTAEWIMNKADELLDATVVKFAPDIGDSARRWLETGIKTTVAAGVGGVGAGFAGAIGGVLLGSPMVRAIARDMQKIGSNIALGARLQPLHRALQATVDAGGNVISPVSKGSTAGLKAYELAFPLLDPVGRFASRVAGGVASVQTLEAMVMQSAIGFLGSGGTWQGAVTGGTVGFGLAGTFGVAGALTPFASQAQVNKLSATNARNYREMLKGTPTGDAFSKLSFEHQKSIAWAMGGFPDTGLKIISDPAQAAGWYNPNTNEIGINTARQDWMRHFARHVAKHEHSHYVARHVGVREKILSTLLGDVNNRKGGLFAKVDAQGKAKFKLDPATRRKIMQSNTAGKTTLQISQELGLSQEAVSSLGSQLTRADLRRGDVFVETNDNFKELTRHYMGLLTPESARDINAKGERYVQEYIAEEIFAEQGAAQLTKYTPSYAKSFRKPLWAKNLEKALNSSRLSGRAPSVLGRLGGLFGSNKKIQSSILGEFSAIPEFKEIFDGYNHSKSINEKLELTEAPGDGVTYAEILDPKDWDPSGADPSTESLKAWLANGMLKVDPQTGIPDGIEVQPDGSWRVRDPRLIRRSVKEAEDAAKEFGKTVEDWLKSNTPVAKTSQEIKDLLDTQLPPGNTEQKTVLDTIQDAVDTGVKDAVQKEIRSQRARSNQATKDYIDQIEQIIDASMVDDDMVAPRITLDGKTIIAGRYLPDELLDFLEQSGRFNPHQLENLRSLNDYLKHGLHATPISVMYQSTMRAGKNKAIAAAEKNVFVTGFEVTKQGNLIYRVWNLDKVMANGAKKMNSQVGKSLYSGDVGQFYQDVYTYFNNYSKGLSGATGLTVAKRDFIRKSIGLGDPNTSSQSGRTPNPYSWSVSALKDAKDTALNSYRLDRTNWIDLGNPRMKKDLDRPLTSRESGQGGSYQRIRENYYPGESAESRAKALEEILKEQKPRPSIKDISVEIIDDPDASFVEHEYTHPDVSSSISLLVYEDGKVEASSSIEIQDDTLNIDGYIYDSIEEAKVDIEELFRQAIEESGRDEFGGQFDNKLNSYRLFEHFAIPEGFDGTKWEQAGTGSWYLDVYHDETGEKTKISIRDHERTSSLHESPDFVEYVSKDWEPKEVKEALDRLEKRIHEELDADDIRYFPGTHLDYETWKKDQPPASEEVLRLQYSRYVESTPEPVYTEADYMELAQDEAANREVLQSMISNARGDRYQSPLLYHGTPDSSTLEAHPVFDRQRLVRFVKDPERAKQIQVELNIEGQKENHPTSRYMELLDEAESNVGYDSQNVPVFFTPNKGIAQTYARSDRAFAPEGDPAVLEFYVDLQNPMIIDARGKGWGKRGGPSTQEAQIQEAKAKGHDGIIIRNTRDSYEDTASAPIHDVYVTFNPNQIKSADPVTYDKKGNIIPLSERFNPSSDDIRYSPGVSGLSNNLAIKILDDPEQAGVVKDIDGAAALLRQSFLEQYGETLTAKEMGDAEIEWFADQLVADAIREAAEVGNATDWYTSAVERMLELAATKFPEIKDKGFEYHTFLAAVAITSQNMKVKDNMKAGIYQYQYWKDNGSFDYTKKHGDKNEAITENLKLFDTLIEELGQDEYMKFAESDFTVRDLSKLISEIKEKDVTIAGYQDDTVKGSAAFGPKIGQGFLQNLLGNYDPVTVDLWLRRTFGRLTGDSVRPELTAQDIGRLIYSVRKRSERGKEKLDSFIELPPVLKGLRLEGGVNKNGQSKHKISTADLNRLFDESTPEGRENAKEVREFGAALAKQWESYYNGIERQLNAKKKVIEARLAIQKKKAKTPKDLQKYAEAKRKADAQIEEAKKRADALRKLRKPHWAFIGKTIKDRTKPVDSPSDLERVVITKAFEIARKKLKDEHGLDYSNADLQALLWYPEKDIWGHLKGDSADSLKADYASAMEEILNE